MDEILQESRTEKLAEFKSNLINKEVILDWSVRFSDGGKYEGEEKLTIKNIVDIGSEFLVSFHNRPSFAVRIERIKLI